MEVPMSAIEPRFLKLIRRLAEDRQASDERFREAIVLGHGLGVPVAEISVAARLSPSRVHGIVDTAAKSWRPLDELEVEHALEHDKTVGLVPAGELAYAEYRKYHAYICQPNRAFRDEMTRLGFYADREVKPEFPMIIKRWHDATFSTEETARLRTDGDDHDTRLADIIDDVLATSAGARKPGRHYDVFLLTPPEHPGTLTLPRPIRHERRGRGQAFVRKQRYTSEAALLRKPKTTTELLALQGR
jgi:hypothetical protein